MLFICGGLMRTGSVAMFQIVRELVFLQGGPAPIMPPGREGTFFDEYVADWANEDFPHALKLHRWRDSLNGLEERMKVVMTIRDMRDVTVSLMNFRGGGFEPAFFSGAFKGNLEGQEEWEYKVPPHNLLKVRYEDFVRNRVETTKNVAAFLRYNIDTETAHKIEKRWNVTANKLRAKEGHPQESPEYMSERHIQSGKVGQWKTALTPEQIMQVQKRVGLQWFLDNGYEPYDPE